MNYEFDLDSWMDKLPLHAEHGRYSGKVITSPPQLCNTEWLRRNMDDQYEWGDSVPADVFAMADGEPENRYATKIGGLPYRPASEPWPQSVGGRHLALLAQFNFTNSTCLNPSCSGRDAREPPIPCA